MSSWPLGTTDQFLI